MSSSNNIFVYLPFIKNIIQDFQLRFGLYFMGIESCYNKKSNYEANSILKAIDVKINEKQ